MNRSREWLVPLTGVGFVLLGIVSFIVGGEPKSADEPVGEIVEYYVDNKDSIQVGVFIGLPRLSSLSSSVRTCAGSCARRRPRGKSFRWSRSWAWSSSRWASPSMQPS